MIFIEFGMETDMPVQISEVQSKATFQINEANTNALSPQRAMLLMRVNASNSHRK